MADTVRVDKFLSNFATRYRVNDNVADFIAPLMKVKESSGKYAKYKKDIFRLYDNKVSGREKAKEISQNIDEGTYTCEEFSLSRFVSDRNKRNADIPANLDVDAVRQLKDAQILSREKRIYDIAGNASIVTQTVDAGGDWDTISSGTPIADILKGMGVIWAASTVKANAIVIPYDVSIQMIATDEYRDYFKYSGLASNEQFNIVSGLRHIGLEPIIVGNFGASTNLGGASDPAIESIWSDSVLLFHRETNPTLESRAFMYSPYIKKDEVRRLEGSEQKRERGVLFDIYEEIDELLIDASAAYLITNTL